MNSIQIHLLLNHLPVIGTLSALLILFFALIRRQEAVRKTGLVVLIVSALFAIPASKSGEEAEELLEEWPGISHDLLHEHEEAAELATPVLLVSGALGLVALFWTQRAVLFSGLALVIGLLGFGAAARAAHLGGLIRHPELIQGAPLSPQGAEQEIQDQAIEESDRSSED